MTTDTTVIQHFGKFLVFAGNPVKEESSRIESLYYKEERLKKELAAVRQEIKEREEKFNNLIKKDWTPEEIEKAKKAAQEAAESQKQAYKEHNKKLKRGI